MDPPTGSAGQFVNPNGMDAEGVGEAQDLPPPGTGDRSQDAIMDALSSILNGQ
jgi:hypothetical protein